MRYDGLLINFFAYFSNKEIAEQLFLSPRTIDTHRQNIMKKLVNTLIVFFALTASAFAQETKTITLEQTKGEFTVKELKLSEGTYVFNILNTGVDHEVGFVLVPDGKKDAADHIKIRKLQGVVRNAAGHSGQAQIVLHKKCDVEENQMKNKKNG